MKPRKSSHIELPEAIYFIEEQENLEIQNIERIETYLL